MKYDLMSQINNYLKLNNKYGKFDVATNQINLLNSSNIPELKGIKVDTNGTCFNGIPLISVDGKKFALYSDSENVTIESPNGIFCVSISEKKSFLQCSIENDIIRTSLVNNELFIQIYLDVLKNGKLIDNLKNLISDTIQSINIEFKEEKENNKRVLIINDGDKKRKVKVPVDMSLVNIIRIVSNAIREEYRKNIGVKKVKRLVKHS